MSDKNKSRSIRLSFRVNENEKIKILKASESESKSLSQFLREKALGMSNSNKNADLLSLADDVAFLFAFFQKNARNLSVSQEERERLKQILEKVRRLKQ